MKWAILATFLSGGKSDDLPIKSIKFPMNNMENFSIVLVPMRYNYVFNNAFEELNVIFTQGLQCLDPKCCLQ